MGYPVPLPKPQPVTQPADPEAVEFFSHVLPSEIQAITARRNKLDGIKYEPLPVTEGPLPDEEMAMKCAEAHRLRPLGLAFSGGGIRSATFNLGILQGLAERGLLPYVDYLSTVSGGGYIGSWFHGLVKRLNGKPTNAQAFLSPTQHPIPGLPETDAISFLRKFSNYLAPNPGLFSTDTWVIGSIWLRNVVLNQLVLLPAIAVLVLVTLLMGFLKQVAIPANCQPWVSVAPAGLLLLVTVWWTRRSLLSVVERSFNEHAEAGAKPPGAGSAVPTLIFIACLILTCLGTLATLNARFLLGAVLLALFTFFQILGGFWQCFKERHLENWDKLEYRVYAVLHHLWMPLLAAGAAWFPICTIWIWSKGVNPWMILAFAPSLACIAIMGGVTVLIGLMGVDYPDGAREWLSNVGSDLSMICAAWSGVFALTVFGPWGISWLLVHYSRSASAALSSWALATLAGVAAGRSTSTNGTNQKGNGLTQFLIQIAPTLFVVGYLLLIAFGVHNLIRNQPDWYAAHSHINAVHETDIQLKVLSTSKSSDVELQSSTTTPNWFESHLQDMADWNTYFNSLQVIPPTSYGFLDRTIILISLSIIAVIIGIIASLRININEFSIHHFYKNRLVRCYMGASHTGRKAEDRRAPDPRTGFDPQDDFPIAKLHPDDAYYGPYAIVNAALNLNAGSELATQERKACSFVFTPKYSGYDPVISKEDERKFETKSPADFQLNGYRLTKGYSSPSGPYLGTAMSISGAAANPNWGYHTSGPMAFLLTIFNVRLGWWLGNSRYKLSSPTPGPRFTLKYLFMELAAQTTARTRYVNLSDGGHFENLGLYELVRRRCRYIIVGDAEEDGGFTFESLGGAIRKCRADFGVEITINPDPIRLGASKFSSAHCVIGSILYPEPERGVSRNLADPDDTASKPHKAQGWLLYMKASLTGNEPTDIAQYRSVHTNFPHEPTADQFYTESQFESYRRLGLHVLRETFADIATDLDADQPQQGLIDMFQELTRKWYAPVSVTVDAGESLNNRYSALMRRLSEDKDLMRDFAGLLPNTRQTPVPHGQLREKSFVFGTEVIQLMEDVVNLFDFEQSANFANPGVSGWRQVFLRWAQCNTFHDRVWLRAKGDFQLGFQKFVTNLRTPPTEEPPPSN